MEGTDPLTGTVVFCSAPSHQENLVRLLVEPSNSEVPIADAAAEQSKKMWVLIAFSPKQSEYGDAGTWISPAREPLAAVVRARRFLYYELKEIELGVPELPANDPRERSICNLHGSVCVPPYHYYQRLVDAGYVTLGDVIDRGAIALSRLGFPGSVIRSVRQRLESFGLVLAPMRGRRAG